MKMSIKDLQEDMLIGLKISGCDVICAMAIAAQLQNPEDMREMLLYMTENSKATQVELYKMSLQISSGRDSPRKSKACPSE